ncbi:MAG: tetratricopeptide repeat protein [Planctomycetota bacterium]
MNLCAGRLSRSGLALVLLAATVPTACRFLPISKIGSLQYERCEDPEAKAALAQADKLIRAGGARDALPFLREALKYCPNHVPTHMLYQDKAKSVGGDAETAMRKYYGRLVDNRRSPLVPFLLARLARHEVECKDYLRTALRRDRRFVWARLEMARMRRSVDQPEVALKEIKKALRVRPGFVPAQKEIAELYLELNDPEHAAPYYRSYLRQRPDDERAQRAYVWLLIHELDRPESAETEVRSLLKKHPGDQALLMELAAIHWRLSRLDQAIATYRQVLRKNRNNATAVLNLGDLYFDWQSARDKDAAWREARKCYRYFLSLEDDSRALLLLNRIMAVPYRLEQINKHLGPPDDSPVQVEDLLGGQSVTTSG